MSSCLSGLISIKTRDWCTLMPKLMTLRVLCSFHQQNIGATLLWGIECPPMRQALRDPHPQRRKREPPKKESHQEKERHQIQRKRWWWWGGCRSWGGIHSDTDSLVAASDSSYDSDLAASSDSCDDCSDPEFNPDALMCSCKDVGLTLPWMPHTWLEGVGVS